MKNLVIASTQKTPEVIFLAAGELMLTGNSFPENTNKFYQPLLEWIEEFKKIVPPKITITLEIEHINTSGIRMVLLILKSLNSIAKGKNGLHVIWKYDKDDKDSLEQGEAMQHVIKKRFEFVEKLDS